VEKHRGAKICFFVIICSLGFVAYGSSDWVPRSLSSIRGHHAMQPAFSGVYFQH
jgi:hypothetical protein